MNEKARKIIELLNEGKTYKQIEQILGASPTTVSKIKHNYPDLILSPGKALSCITKDQSSGKKKTDDETKIENSSKNSGEIPEGLFNTFFNELRDYRIANERLFVENVKLTTEIEKMSEKEKEKDGLIQNLTDKLNKEKENNQKHERINRKNSEVHGKYNELAAEYSKLQQQYHATIYKLTHLEERNSVLADKMEDLRSKLIDAEERYNRLDSRHDSYVEETEKRIREIRKNAPKMNS